MLFNKLSMKSIHLLVSVNGPAGIRSQTIAGGLPRQSDPEWIQLDGDTDDELLTKIFVNTLAAYAFAMEGADSAACDKLREGMKTKTDFLNKLLKNLS